MKKSGFFAVGMLMVLFALTGCASELKSSYNGTTLNIGVPVKNIEILGIVRYEAIVANGNGEKVTYDALLKEAEKVGGNGIANVMIDVKREGLQLFSLVLNPKETWYGSALAIKYTNDNLAANVPYSTSEGGLESGAGTGILGLLP
jgi:hypothetical protein